MVQLNQVKSKADFNSILLTDKSIKSTWSVRKLQLEKCSIYNVPSNYTPKAGDVVLIQIEKIANHTRIFSVDNKYSRLYIGDIIIGTLGYRYATEAFHAEIIDISKLHLLTNAGLIGTVESHHSKTNEPTQGKLIGLVYDNSQKKRINLKEVKFPIHLPNLINQPTIFVVGTGMSSGKTTSTARVGKALIENGISVSLLKVTGSVSSRDLAEFESTGVEYTSDFSDYGFPSTYLCTKDEVLALYTTMVNDSMPHSSVTLIEIADGILQRETQMLLQSDIAKASNIGVILTAPCSCSALTLIDKIRQLGYTPLAVTGLITNSPLFVREFADDDNTPVINTKTNIRQFVDIISKRLENS
ncbi:MAG: DUF1611 domain-containing protein [Planctomycetia bacterium]|nr:DUF1611 domain-containing protein [Planctomycetia bacterium]